MNVATFKCCVMAALLVPAMSWGADAASTGAPLRCESLAAGREKLDVTCAWRAGAVTRRHRFTAHFSGSHDDTRLAMTVTLDGRPLTCESGSQTNLEGEDGDVSLHCVVPAAAQQVGTVHVLRVRLAWWHALHSHVDFSAE